VNKSSLIAFSLLGTCLVSPLNAQTPAAPSPALQEQVAALKAAMAKNKQQLALYTWVETVTISLKGEQKKQERSQVKMGADGKPIKTPLDQPAAAQPPESAGGRRGGRIKEHVVEKKKEEFKDYADSLKSLMQLYVPPDKDLLQKAQQAGKITMGPGAGSETQVQLVIHDYVKPNDSMTLVLDKAQKQLVGLQVASYLDDAQDKANLTVNFANLTDGTNHVDSTVLEGVSKQLKVAIQNSNYQKL
jgi:hypothetical protein